MTNPEANVGNWEDLFTPGGEANPYNLYGNWCVSSSKRKK